MVLAYHVIFTAYGFWLPNDPRGSYSDFVRSWELYLAGGPATKVTTRRSVAGAPHDRAARLRTKEALTYPAVTFDGHQALAIARGFERMAAKSKYTVHACSILPEHVHMVIDRHHYRVETMVRLLKGEASMELASSGRHPLAAWPQANGLLPSPWGRGHWKVFLKQRRRHPAGDPLCRGQSRQGREAPPALAVCHPIPPRLAADRRSA